MRLEFIKASRQSLRFIGEESPDTNSDSSELYAMGNTHRFDSNIEKGKVPQRRYYLVAFERQEKGEKFARVHFALSAD